MVVVLFHSSPQPPYPRSNSWTLQMVGGLVKVSVLIEALGTKRKELFWGRKVTRKLVYLIYV